MSNRFKLSGIKKREDTGVYDSDGYLIHTGDIILAGFGGKTVVYKDQDGIFRAGTFSSHGDITRAPLYEFIHEVRGSKRVLGNILDNSRLGLLVEWNEERDQEFKRREHESI